MKKPEKLKQEFIEKYAPGWKDFVAGKDSVGICFEKDLNELIKEAPVNLIMKRKKIFKAIAGLCHNNKAADEAVTRILDLFNVSTRTLKIGDTVEIIGNIPFQLKNKPKPLLGKITNIDGAYILVKPKYQRYECEFYSGELAYVY